eukprot:jgi/Chrzof1/13611/Cz08g04040.t1
MDIEPTDKVVRELDVYVCQDISALKTQLCLLQQPLRPNWRPYDMHKASKARFKPQAKRFELDIPLEKDSRNYTPDTEQYKQIDRLTLRSSQTDAAKASYAVGLIKDDQLLLLPLDYTLQLRPHTSFLNVDKTKKGVDGEESEDEAAEREEGAAGPSEPQLTAVEVQVKRRETERQQAARLKSFGYLQQEEESEKWVDLSMHTAESSAGAAVWSKLTHAHNKDITPCMTRQQYLQSFMPSVVSEMVNGQEQSTAQSASEAAGPSGSGQHAAGVRNDTISAELQAAINTALKALFARHGVCTLGNVRQCLQSYELNPKAKEGASLSDRALHGAVLASGNSIVCIRRTYVQTTMGHAATDPLRAVVVDLLRDKESVKRGDVMQAAQQAGLSITDGLYIKVMKELCHPRGNNWSLKAGADL